MDLFTDGALFRFFRSNKAKLTTEFSKYANFHKNSLHTPNLPMRTPNLAIFAKKCMLAEGGGATLALVRLGCRIFLSL